jgi:hypothetical protein
MRRPPRRPARKPVSSAVCLCVAAALSGCSAASSSPASSSPGGLASAAATGHPAGASSAFTVTGVNPVPANGSQDTFTETPDASCDPATLAADHATGVKVASGFALAGFSAAAELLTHFLSGRGTAVHYGAGSQIAAQARASAAFQAVNTEVTAAILSQLKAGQAHVRLSAVQLPAVAFEATSSDLYWGFRGTQGLAVTGTGVGQNGRYTGTLSYLIQDSYGFPADDTLDGFGPPMRYLQTSCGAPQHAGGARWFPDTITVQVPFSQPA